MLMFLIVNRVMKNMIFLCCFPEPELNSFAFRSNEVKKILLTLILLELLTLMVFFPLFCLQKLLILWLLKFPLFFISWLEWAPLPLVGDIVT